ncbi:hypothetical protein SAMN04487968_105148 [Nocardioides terrae]|uniref:Polymerase nucleotidyl transferase domain-containing protein n=1 Tax=Nocardioides terrae TaxID=574651 RepID=A0A1I1IBT7_9ACTN|nr:hypothetical protein SAMN04487968_105148 [Nocardioides terrae]
MSLGYARSVGAASAESISLREGLLARRDAVAAILDRYAATNPRVFGSVARGDATATSDIDLLVELLPDRGNALLRIAGLSEELSVLLGVRVDVVSQELLREPVAASALLDAIAV